MKVVGRCYFQSEKGHINIEPTTDDYMRFKEFVSRWIAKNEKTDKIYPVELKMEMVCNLAELMKGKLGLKIDEYPVDISLEVRLKKRNLNQNNTYWGILYFIYWAQHGRKPIGDDTRLYDEAIKDMFDYYIEEDHPFIKGQKIKRRKTHREMTVVEFARMIDKALKILAEQDIPKMVLDQIGKDMKSLWRNWYNWKNQEEGLMDILEPDDMCWSEYIDNHPVCELSGIAGNEGDPLVRMHLVANLQGTPMYEMPRFYIRARQSLHQKQHTEGWDIILQEYPHIKAKWEKAQLCSDEYRKLNTNNELEIF